MDTHKEGIKMEEEMKEGTAQTLVKVKWPQSQHHALLCCRPVL
jgi:hypothetical protein